MRIKIIYEVERIRYLASQYTIFCLCLSRHRQNYPVLGLQMFGVNIESQICFEGEVFFLLLLLEIFKGHCELIQNCHWYLLP